MEKRSSKSLEKLKPYLEVLVGFAAVASVIVSLRGCQIAGRANRTAQSANGIAESALETSRQQFIQINRPYVTLSPKKYSNGQYWKLAQQGESVVAELQYEVKNVGNVAAKDVNLPDTLVVGSNTKLKKGTPVTYRKMNAVTLGPGQHFVLDFQMQADTESPDGAKRLMEHLLSDKSDGILIQVSVDYASEVDKSQKYTTLVMTRIHNDRAQLIKSEMLSLTEEADELKDRNKPPR